MTDTGANGADQADPEQPPRFSTAEDVNPPLPGEPGYDEYVARRAEWMLSMDQERARMPDAELTITPYYDAGLGRMVTPEDPAPEPEPLTHAISGGDGADVPVVLDGTAQGQERPWQRSDAANGELFAQLYGHHVRYDHRRGRWLLWGGDWWRPDETDEIRILAKDAARLRYEEATRIQDLRARTQEAGFAITSENRYRLEAMLAQAKSEPPIADAGDAWDADPWLFGVSNGIVDLRSGTLRRGIPADRVTNHTDIAFDADATTTDKEITIKAIVRDRYGSPDVLALRDIDRPTIKDDEVLVGVHASSLNGTELDVLKGTFAVRFTGPRRPRHRVLGSDIAGRVEAVGPNVKGFQPGDEVFGDLGFGFGAFAEYAGAPEDVLTLKPASLTFEQVATLPQAAVLALQGLRHGTQVQPGEKVLINGAGGGAGTFAVHIAKSFGAEVTGVDSAMKLDMVRSIGADHVIDYAHEDFTRNGERYDRIVDFVAYRSTFDYRRALSPDGRYVVLGGSSARILQTMTLGRLLSMTGSQNMGLLIWKPNQKEDMAFLIDLLESGQVAPVIDRSYPLAEVPEALRRLKEGDVQGKVVITMEHRDDAPSTQ